MFNTLSVFLFMKTFLSADPMRDSPVVGPWREGRRAQCRGCAQEIHGLQGGEERQRCRDGGGAVRAEVVGAANTRRGEWVAKDRRDRAVKTDLASREGRKVKRRRDREGKRERERESNTEGERKQKNDHTAGEACS